jgi:hypothetical protein
MFDASTQLFEKSVRFFFFSKSVQFLINDKLPETTVPTGEGTSLEDISSIHNTTFIIKVWYESSSLSPTETKDGKFEYIIGRRYEFVRYFSLANSSQ